MIAGTSPMGWNSWDCYGAAVTEDIVRKNARYMADNLKQFGYEYVVVDIQWYEPGAVSHEYNAFARLCMDEYSRLIPAEERFPSAAGGRGFGPLADYVHSLGLKFGIHIMRGVPRQAVHSASPIKGSDKTARDIAAKDSICSWNTDMYGVDAARDGAFEYYKSLFQLYASWGVDFIKCDDICRELPRAEEELKLISRAIKASGREMVLSISPGAAILEKAELYKQVSQMWRITDDFWDEWRLLYDMFERCEKWSIHTGPGHWPDADMLPVGYIKQDYDENITTQFTEDEQRTMLTLWSIFRSPLMIGCELTKMDGFTMSLLTNTSILGMHKNARHAHQVWRRELEGKEHILWTAPAAGGGQYLALFNVSEEQSSVTVSLEDAEIMCPARLEELWTGESITSQGTVTCNVPPHGAKVYFVKEV